MPSRPWIFICPSSRGIGHALTRHLLQHTRLPILATTRQRDTSSARVALLQGLELPPSSSKSPSGQDRLTLVQCDVADEASVREAAAAAEELFPPQTHHLHLGCAIPGVLLRPEKSPAQIEAEMSVEAFRVNAVGPMVLMKHFGRFLPKKATQVANDIDGVSQAQAQTQSGENGIIQLPRHATWLSMAARVGSTSDNRAGGWYSYRASKAAVISFTRGFDIYLQAQSGDKALAVAYHPGTVATDFSRAFWANVPAGKLFEPDLAAAKMVDVIRGLEVGQRGRCWDWKEDEVVP